MRLHNNITCCFDQNKNIDLKNVIDKTKNYSVLTARRTPSKSYPPTLPYA